MKFELPSELPQAEEAQHSLHSGIAFRAIVTAAKGGKLRSVHLDAKHCELYAPFACRSLLPLWVGVEHWQLGSHSDYFWVSAAQSLRPALAHVSLWMDSKPGLSKGRLLTGRDVQSLQSHLSKEVVSKLLWRDACESRRGHETIERYLPWLTVDSELSQQVADAWNVLVEKGKADLVRCACNKCRSRAYRV